MASRVTETARTVTIAKPRTPDGADTDRVDDPGASMKLAIGQQLGHFRVDKLLGAGGMGEVYLATDLALDRPVALKVLPAASAREADRRDRLVREARAQARVAHPHVGHIYFIGEDTGRLYFAMELIDGVTLAERIGKGPVPIDEAIAMVRAAALGLREAQKMGVTHRDVKPSNLMIDSHGVVKVLDFGLAAQLPDGALDPDAPVAQTSTAGTPLYMAPEQARGEPIDARADIYALGATLYHLVAGQPPFFADSLEQLRSLHETAARPALKRTNQPRASLAAVGALCARMMAPAPADRIASYDDVLRELELASAVRTRPAGIIVRCLATVIDLMIAFAVVGGLGIAAELLLDTGETDASFVFYVVFALYATLAVARRGRTVGHWLFELEVIAVDTGHKPTTRRAAIRAFASIAVPVGVSLVSFGFRHSSYAPIEPVQYALLLLYLANVVLLFAALRSPVKRTAWDRMSGTLVRYRTTRTAADGLVR